MMLLLFSIRQDLMSVWAAGLDALCFSRLFLEESNTWGSEPKQAAADLFDVFPTTVIPKTFKLAALLKLMADCLI